MSYSLFREPHACCVWVLLIIKTLESFAYFVFALLTTQYLVHTFGIESKHVVWLHALKEVMVCVYAFLAAPFIDRWGVRYVSILGIVVLLLSRVILAMTRSYSIAAFSLLFLLPLGLGLSRPALAIALKRYSNRKTHRVAFGLYFIMLNIGVLLALAAAEALQLNMSQGAPDWIDRPYVYQITASRTSLLLAAFASLLSLGLAAVFLGNDDLSEEGKLAPFKDGTPSLWSSSLETLSSSSFWYHCCVLAPTTALFSCTCLCLSLAIL
jgi:MFS family permease